LKRLFYMNINYICNNRCIFCLSHNTKNASREVVHPFALISVVDREFRLNSHDVFVINGGEPTLSEEFFQIVSFLSAKCRRVIVYTNGRSLSETTVKQALKIENIRWIIPFYGLQETHTKLSGNENAFYETYNNLLSVDEMAQKRIDIKILLNNDISEDEIRHLTDTFQDFACLHISCLNNRNLYDIKNRILIIKRLRNCILPLFTDCSSIKISNIPLCEIEEEGKNKFGEMIKGSLSEKINKYYFLDINKTRKIKYNQQHGWMGKCAFCRCRSICVDTNRHFRVAKHQNSRIWLEEE